MVDRGTRTFNRQRGQSTLEWVIGAAVILGTMARQRDHFPNSRAARRAQA